MSAKEHYKRRPKWARNIPQGLYTLLRTECQQTRRTPSLRALREDVEFQQSTSQRCHTCKVCLQYIERLKTA